MSKMFYQHYCRHAGFFYDSRTDRFLLRKPVSRKSETHLFGINARKNFQLGSSDAWLKISQEAFYDPTTKKVCHFPHPMQRASCFLPHSFLPHMSLELLNCPLHPRDFFRCLTGVHCLSCMSSRNCRQHAGLYALSDLSLLCCSNAQPVCTR